MKDHKRHLAAHSGAPVTSVAAATSQVPISLAATIDMKVAKPPRHPAPGCSLKQVGEVKGVLKK